MSTANYQSLLRSTIITGGARFITVILSFVRFKLIAVCVGPAGFGLIALFNSSLGLISAISSLGLDASGVRQVAASAGAAAKAEDAGDVIVALRRLAWITGIFGTSTCFLLSEKISHWTFGSPDHASEYRLLSATILLAQLSLGQSAVLRGLRRVKELAMQSIAVSLITLIVSAGLLISLGKDGLAPMLVVSSCVTLAGTWWYSRRVPVGASRQNLSETLTHAKSLVSLGTAFLLGTLISSAGHYFVSVMIHEQGGTSANGLYQAAWSCTVALSGFVLGAMGHDFYPQLTALADDKSSASKLIDQQVEVALLMALPGLSLVVAISPLLLPFLFTPEFGKASELINWFALGCLGRVLALPLGYYLLSCGLGRLYILTELVFVATHLLLVWHLLPSLGLVGACISFAVLYLLYWAGLVITVRVHSGYLRSARIYKIAAASGTVIFLCGFIGTLPALALSLWASYICLRKLVQLVGPESKFARYASAIPLLGRYLIP